MLNLIPETLWRKKFLESATSTLFIHNTLIFFFWLYFPSFSYILMGIKQNLKKKKEKSIYNTKFLLKSFEKKP